MLPPGLPGGPGGYATPNLVGRTRNILRSRARTPYGANVRQQQPYGPGHPPPSPGGVAPPPPGPPRPPGTPPAAGSNNAYNFSGDPILQQILGQGVKLNNEADAQMVEDQRKSLLGFGSVAAAQKLFGANQGFVQSVGANPYSTLANIAHKYDGTLGMVNQTNENENAGNLYFSSDRLNTQLPEVYRQRGQDTYTATNSFQDAMEQIMQQNLGVHNQQAQNAVQAQQEAATRAVQAALASGYGPGAQTTQKVPPTQRSGWYHPGYGGF